MVPNSNPYYVGVWPACTRSRSRREGSLTYNAQTLRIAPTRELVTLIQPGPRAGRDAPDPAREGRHALLHFTASSRCGFTRKAQLTECYEDTPAPSGVRLASAARLATRVAAQGGQRQVGKAPRRATCYTCRQVRKLHAWTSAIMSKRPQQPSYCRPVHHPSRTGRREQANGVGSTI